MPVEVASDKLTMRSDRLLRRRDARRGLTKKAADAYASAVESIIKAIAQIIDRKGQPQGLHIDLRAEVTIHRAVHDQASMCQNLSLVPALLHRHLTVLPRAVEIAVMGQNLEDIRQGLARAQTFVQTAYRQSANFVARSSDAERLSVALLSLYGRAKAFMNGVSLYRHRRLTSRSSALVWPFLDEWGEGPIAPKIEAILGEGVTPAALPRLPTGPNDPPGIVAKQRLHSEIAELGRGRGSPEAVAQAIVVLLCEWQVRGGATRERRLAMRCHLISPLAPPRPNRRTIKSIDYPTPAQRCERRSRCASPLGRALCRCE